MPYNGSGIFTLGSGNPVVTGTVISSTWANNTLADIANNGLSNCITKDGQTTPTANIGLGGFRLTNVAAGIQATDGAQIGQIQGGTISFLGSVSGTNTITGTATPTVTAYSAGQVFRFVSVGSNSSSSVTLNIGSLGAKSVTKTGAVLLSPGDIPSGALIEVVYDGTQFQVIGGLLQGGALPPRYRDLSRGHIAFNNTTSVTFNAGAWRDVNNTADLILTSNTFKVLQAAGSWTAGSGQNGLFAGTRANSTWYQCFIIRKTSDGTLDAGFDTSISAANIPSGYAAYRRVGAVLTDGSGNIRFFVQDGDLFTLDPKLNIVSNAGIATGVWQNITTGIFGGINLVAHLNVTNPAGTSISFESSAQGSAPVSGTYDIGPSSTQQIKVPFLGATSSFVFAWASATVASGLYITLRGWSDFSED